MDEQQLELFLGYDDEEESIAVADDSDDDVPRPGKASQPAVAPVTPTLMSSSATSSTCPTILPNPLEFDDVAYRGGGMDQGMMRAAGPSRGEPLGVARSAYSATGPGGLSRPIPIGSLPMRPASASGAMHMATSVPVPVTNFRGWLHSASAQPPAPEPFVPPHKLMARDDFGLDPNGGSPSACIKRDRLRMRNCVLRSTGFLE